MVDKEEKEKLTEALKEYFGNDVGDIKDIIAVPRNRRLDLENNMKDYNDFLIMTEPHQPTFKDKLEDLIDQLDKDLKEIDDNYSVVKGIASPDVTYIHYYARPYCELYPNGNINFHGVYDSVKRMTKAMEVILDFSRKLKRLREQYKND